MAIAQHKPSMQINARYCKSDISVWLLLINNYPLLTDILTHMIRRKYFYNFEEIRFAVESRLPNFCRTPNRLSRTSFARTAPFQRNRRCFGTREFRNYHQYHQPRQRLVSQNDYVCYYHRCFHENASHCEGQRGKFFKQSSCSAALNCQGRQYHIAN